MNIVFAVIYIIFGLITLTFYKFLGKLATKQRADMMGSEYKITDEKFNSYIFFVGGIVFILFGISDILHILNVY